MAERQPRSGAKTWWISNLLVTQAALILILAVVNVARSPAWAELGAFLVGVLLAVGSRQVLRESGLALNRLVLAGEVLIVAVGFVAAVTMAWYYPLFASLLGLAICVILVTGVRRPHSV